MSLNIFPEDADGDVLRRLQEANFDFSRPCLIDFNVDFEEWPPDTEAVRLLSRRYPSTKAYEPEDGLAGYLQFQVHERLTHQLVMVIQEEVSDLMGPFGGICESWGVLQE